MRISKEIAILRATRVDHVAHLGDETAVLIRRYNVLTGGYAICGNCVFRGNGQGAHRCAYTLACFAHNRPDHEPVIFEEVKR